MKQSTSFAHVATNLLNVLQGYTKSLRLLLVMFLTLTVSANAWGETLTLNNLGASLTSTSNEKISTTTITATGDNTSSYVINYLQCKKQTYSSSHAMLLAKSTGAFISNKTAMPGNIKSVTVYVLTNAASKTTYHCAFSTTECTSAYTTGSTAVNITGGSSNKYTCTVSNAKYFCISLGNASNGQVYKLEVEYEVDTPPSCTTNPTVSAGSHSNVTTTTATVSCTNGITSLGSAGCSIESYGFVYGTSSNPTISNTKVQVGTTYTTTGTAFSKELTGLTANTTYYVRPYATNGNGTAYGTQTSFKTLELPKYTVTLNAGPGTCAASVTETSAGAGVTLPTPTLDGCGEWSFAGWTISPVEEEITEVPNFITDKPYKPSGDVTLYAVYQRTETTEGVETTTTTTDKLTRETTGITKNSTSYSNWSGKTANSSAVYAGQSAGGNDAIQLRTTNSNSGIITTASGGKAKKITVEWQSSTASGRTLDIYGKNSAYSAATDLYSTSTQGTKLGSIVNGTSTELTITGDYEYIGLRSNSNAMYLTSISIEWETSTGSGTSSTTYYHSTPECTTKTSVTLNPNGGRFASDPEGWTKDGNNYVITHTGTEITLPTNISQEGKIFGGWYKEETKYETIPADLTESITLTAKWSDKQDSEIAWNPTSCNVTIDAGGQLPIFQNPNNLTPITFESSNSEVASVDNNGVITLGTTATTATVTITATFDGNATYAAKEATCTLTVHPSNCRWVETEIGNIEPEDEVLVTMRLYNGNTYTLDHSKGTSDLPPAQIITINGNEATFLSLYHSNSIWNISGNATDGYILYPNGQTNTWLYCTKSSNNVKVGTTTNNVFTIDNGYLKHTNTDWVAYLGVYINGATTVWRHHNSPTAQSIANQTLKFYKKTCLPANKFWIDYELANVTCTSEKPAFVGADTEIELSFSAYTGYKLPEQVSITMGGNTLSEEAFAWEAEEGILYIFPEDGITGDIVITIEGCELLTIPTNLKANNITSSSATLSWDEIDHATEYQVHITDDDDSTEDIITTTSNTYYEVTGLSSASEYLWGVTPIASGYCGLTQEAEIFTTLDVHTVTFTTNGGTDVESQTVDHGTKATKPTDPTKTGYKFAGWYTEADTEFNFNTPIESATTLYAKWTANQYTITLRQQWGSGGTETVTVHFDNNDFSVSPIIVPTRNGYTFGGYYTAESGAGTQLIDVSGAWLNAPTYIEGGKWVYADNLTLYAKWTQNFTITWMANGQPYHSQTAMMGTAIAKPDDPDEFACNDKVFVGWLDKTISGSTNEEPTFVTDFGTIQAAETYHAVFATLTQVHPSNDYNKITDINDLTDGEYVIAYSYNGGTQVVLKNTTKDANYMNASALAPSSNKYTSPSAEYIWQLQKQDDGSYYMYNSSVNKFLYATTSALQLSDNPTKYTISYDNNYSHWKIKLSDNTSYYMHGYVSGSSYDFRVSTSGSGNNYRVYLYKNASTAVYSEYVTTCVEIPEPVWNGAEISHSNIKVNCGEYTTLNAADPNNGPATISFPIENNLDLTYPITLTVTEGNFLLSTNKTDYSKYTTSVEVAPNKTGDNVGKITQNVYVIAIAPAGSGGDFTGTITISGQQIATQTITVTAEVSCTQYTLTFNDQGQTKTVEGFAGTSVVAPEPWAETCSEPFKYVFDGWATAPVINGTEGYEKVDFSTFTMPNNNTTILYAVYRYAEEGGEPVNGFVKVTEALSDWTGDYVIVNETAKKAIGNAYKTDTKNDKTLIATDVTIIDNKIHNPTDDVIWQIRKSGLNYTMYNADASKYAYITGGDSENAGLSDAVQYINISWGSSPTTVRVIGSDYSGRCFSYYTNGNEWRTYAASGNNVTGALYKLSNKSLLYTSSLICGEISVEEDNVVVTSTKDQTVKVYVPITLKYSGAASITGTSDNEAFTVVTKNDVAVGESNIEVHYKPTAYVNTANQEETATITLTTSNGATTTFNVTGRCLPETFAIVAKVGNVWYALPSQGLNSETTPVGYPIEVDNNDNPKAVTSLPTKAEWELRNVYKVNGLNDRFAANGENLVFVNAENKTLYANNGNANIQTYAEYTNYAENNPERYEWVPTTTDLTNYTLKNVGRDKDLSINVNATFGTHASNIASNNLRFLPINATYNPFDMQVVEWYPTKVLVQTEAALTSVSATVGGVAVANPGVTKKGGKLYEISGLPLENNPTKILTISYDSYSCSKVIPIIISQDTKTVSDAPFSTLTKAIYNYSDLVVRDGAVLNITGAKNTPDKFVNVTIYPTAKIVVPKNNQLSVYSLTFFGGIDDIYDGEKYTTNKYGVPQLSLKGTLGKTVTTMDYIMRVNLDQMYQVGVPYDVNLNEITYWDGSAIILGDELFVSAYDGQARANLDMSNTWRWEVNFDEKVLKAGVGYTISAEPQVENDAYSILRMPMKNNIASGNTEESKQVPVIAYANQNSVQIADNHKGWNYLSNPYMTAISGGDADSKILLGSLQYNDGSWELVNTGYRYVTIPYNDGEDYYQQKFSEATLLPFKSFFLQIAENGNLSFALANRQAAPARYLQQAADMREVEFEILLANATRSDNMGLLISEEYTPDYEINADLEKMIGSMSVYSIYNGYNLAYNAINPTNAHDWIPIGYSVPDVGEYTFSLDEDVDLESVEHIYLIDYETSEMTDLVEYEYTFQTSEKKNDARFAIQVRLSQKHDNTTTVLDNLNATDNKSSKFIYNEQLYILRNGNIYDATGKFVTTINK